MSTTEPTFTPHEDIVRAATPSEMAAAKAMAMWAEYDGCFERIAEWEQMEERERANEYPSDDFEDAAIWVQRARAGLAAVSSSAPTEDDREARVGDLLEEFDEALIGVFDDFGVQDALGQGEDEPLARSIRWLVEEYVTGPLARRSPVAPSEDVAKLIERVLRGVESALVESESHPTNRATRLRRAVSAALRSGAAVPVETPCEHDWQHETDVIYKCTKCGGRGADAYPNANFGQIRLLFSGPEGFRPDREEIR